MPRNLPTRMSALPDVPRALMHRSPQPRLLSLDAEESYRAGVRRDPLVEAAAVAVIVIVGVSLSAMVTVA